MQSEALSEFFTAFLQPIDSMDSGFAGKACAEQTFRNFIMAGSLKSYYFASEGCAASYSSGLPVKKCLYDDADMCPDPEAERWALRAYSDLEVNVVCAGASYLVDYRVSRGASPP